MFIIIELHCQKCLHISSSRSADPQIRVIDAKGPYNFSRSCNLGVAAASGEVVIFYNDDVFVITPDWIQAILEVLTLPGSAGRCP